MGKTNSDLIKQFPIKMSDFDDRINDIIEAIGIEKWVELMDVIPNRSLHIRVRKRLPRAWFERVIDSMIKTHTRQEIADTLECSTTFIGEIIKQLEFKRKYRDYDKKL